MTIKLSKDQCSFVYRSGSFFPGHILGGVSLGQCENKCVPGFVVCHEHVNKEALLLMLQQQAREIATLKEMLNEKGKAG